LHLTTESNRDLSRYLAGAVLDNNIPILADGSGLLGIGLGRPSVGLRLEMVLLRVRHADLSEPLVWIDREEKEAVSEREGGAD
jgi:hypothetical protein